MKIDDASGAVLCGGKSLRMGRDKAAVLFEGEPLLARAARRLSAVFSEVLVVGAGAGGANDLALPAGVRLLADETPGHGPLGGIVTALGAASRKWVFVAACDMPFLDEGLVARLWEEALSSPGVPAVAPRLDGKPQPLAALYSHEALAPAREAVERGKLCLWRFLEEIGASYVEIEPGSPESRALADLDTEADLAAAEREC